MDSWGQLSSFKHHVYWLTLWKENDGCWWLLMHRKWMLYSECCQQDFLTLAWLTGLTCPPLDLYIFKHLSISSIICMSSGVLWPQVLISDLPFTVIRVEHFIAMSTSQLPKWPSLFFPSHDFQKLKIKEIVRSQVKKVCHHSKLLMTVTFWLSCDLCLWKRLI